MRQKNYKQVRSKANQNYSLLLRYLRLLDGNFGGCACGSRGRRRLLVVRNAPGLFVNIRDLFRGASIESMAGKIEEGQYFLLNI